MRSPVLFSVPVPTEAECPRHVHVVGRTIPERGKEALHASHVIKHQSVSERRCAGSQRRKPLHEAVSHRVRHAWRFAVKGSGPEWEPCYGGAVPND